jgi:cobyrinic acid a,c-diamide synthase
VVFNQVSSPAHFRRLREACADAGVDCLGYLPVMESCKLPSKHTAISLANRRALDEIANLMADQLEQTVDVNRLLSRCSRNFPCQYTLPYSSDVESDFYAIPMRKLKIAIARDPAFCFTYRENLSKLAKRGNIVHFSPLYGYELPEADLVYLPGGYPELFARQLHRRHKMMEALKEYAEKGGKILAEGGGMAFLSRTLKSRENGTAYPMSNVLPFDFAVSASGKVCAGYRKTTFGTMNLKGYEFRYTEIQSSETSSNAEIPLWYRYKNVIASPAHWYWGDKDIMQLWQ